MLSLNNCLGIKKVIRMLVNLNLPPSEIALELMKIKLEPGQEIILCMEYLECCFENSAEYNKYCAEIIQVNIQL